jgi:hypothetical protein
MVPFIQVVFPLAPRWLFVMLVKSCGDLLPELLSRLNKLLNSFLFPPIARLASLKQYNIALSGASGAIDRIGI